MPDPKEAAPPVRSEIVLFRTTPEELARLDRERGEKTRSEFIRERLPLAPPSES